MWTRMIHLRVFCIVSLYTWFPMPGAGQNICPPVSELSSKQEMTTYIHDSELRTFSWRRPSDDEPVLTCDFSQCIQTTAGYSGTVSSSDRVANLTIANVEKRDNGNWTLKGGNFTLQVCRLVTARTPQCRITSDKDSHDLDLGDTLTLTANVSGYYCSERASFALITEDVTQMNLTVKDDDEVVNATFVVNLASFGDVSLNFTCESRTWALNCDGVRKLIKSRPQCNISSNKLTDALALGDELTLTVDIKGYYCPRAVGFTLTTGNITEELLGNHAVQNVTDATKNITFSFTTARQGPVIVNYKCDGDVWPLTCGGIKELTYKTITSTWPATSQGTSTATSEESTTTPDPSLTTGTITSTWPTTSQEASTATAGESTTTLDAGLTKGTITSTWPTTSQEASTATAGESTTTPDAGLTIGAIIGIIIGVVVFMVLMVVVLVVVCRHKHFNRARQYIVQRWSRRRGTLSEEKSESGVGSPDSIGMDNQNYNSEEFGGRQ